MEENNEFQKIGKKLPYKVSEDFFGQISEKTLREAKVRKQHKGKHIFLWRSVAAASLIAAAVLIGFLVINQPEETKLTAQNDQIKTEQAIKQESPAQIQPVIEKKPTKTPEKAKSVEADNEKLTDVLTDLSDEELFQLAAMIKTDPFIGESIQ